MQEHANRRQDQTFVIMFLMICCQFVNISEDDSRKFEAISLFVPGLLVLVSSVVENEGKSKVARVWSFLCNSTLHCMVTTCFIKSIQPIDYGRDELSSDINGTMVDLSPLQPYILTHDWAQKSTTTYKFYFNKYRRFLYAFLLYCSIAGLGIVLTGPLGRTYLIKLSGVIAIILV